MIATFLVLMWASRSTKDRIKRSVLFCSVLFCSIIKAEKSWPNYSAATYILIYGIIKPKWHRHSIRERCKPIRRKLCREVKHYRAEMSWINYYIEIL